LLFALLATACLASWQDLTVHNSYRGNWTGLFCTGSINQEIPPALASEHIFRFPDSVGYDGQFYHFIAHDPLLRRNFSAFVDDPRYRYPRILVPGLAFLLAFGNDARIDAAYICVVWLSIFLGAYWFGRFAVLRGYPAWLAILFALAPAVLVSIDRLTVDSALAACTAGFALFTTERSHYKLYAVLAAAGLARETGLLLLAAWCIYLIGKRLWRQAAIFATAGIPTICWFLFVRLHTPPHEFETVSLSLFTGIAGRFLHPFPYPFGGAVRILAVALDLLALAGIAAALVWAAYRAWRRAWSPVPIAIYLFALLTIALSTPVAWSEVYAFGRALTHMVMLAAFDGLTVGTAVPILFMLAGDPRIGLQMGGQILNVVRGLIR
jgi:hypothetical protein